MTDSDITILGAGPVGATLALLLARQTPNPSRIRLCRSPDPARPADQESASTVRALALNYGSRVLLESLGAWPQRGAHIHTIHVSQRGRLGRTVIRHTDFDVPELGAVHPYTELIAALDQALTTSGITIQTGPPAAVVAEDGNAVRLSQGDQLWSSRLVVQAEGKGQDGLWIERDYQQHAILTTLQVSTPITGWAWERFTRDGPIALLPLQDPTASGQTYSLVWCCRPEHAKALQDASDADFNDALNVTFGNRLGTLTVKGARQVQPLRLRWRRDPLHGRTIAIGNAAQTLHPVAGQGLNLGLRDAAQLAQQLARWQAQPLTDPSTSLQHFLKRRQADRRLTSTITDFLPRVFSTGLAPVEHICGLSLLALDTIPGLRRPLTQQLLLGLRS